MKCVLNVEKINEVVNINCKTCGQIGVETNSDDECWDCERDRIKEAEEQQEETLEMMGVEEDD